MFFVVLFLLVAFQMHSNQIFEKSFDESSMIQKFGKEYISKIIDVVEKDYFEAEIVGSKNDNIEGDFWIQFIDVGQADAALVQCNGEYAMIDGGNPEDDSTIRSVLKEKGIDSLKLLVATHGHADHIAGISSALKDIPSETVLCSVDHYDSYYFRNFVKYADKNGGIHIPDVGDIFSLGEAEIIILGVNSDDEDHNDTSIVLKIQYGDTSFLFTGDAERPAEQVILDSGADLSATVLKVGHHGSSSGTTYPFLREIMPEYAVISVGEDNEYGHPTEQVLSRLEDADVTVFRTDLNGTITCISDGNDVSFLVEKN